MLVKELIQKDLEEFKEALAENITKLEGLGAPSIIIKNRQGLIEQIEKGTYKIHGQQKYAAVMNEEILAQLVIKVHVHNKGNKLAYAFKTESGKYSYCPYTKTVTAYAGPMLD